MNKFFLIILFFSNCFYSQYSPKEIDSLMTKEYYKLRDLRKFQEIIVLCNTVIKDSKKINYLKGEIYGYTRLGNMQFNMRNYKEALESLNHANEILEYSKINDNTIRASIHLGIGLCYSESVTSSQNTLIQYNKALFYANKIEDEYEKKFYLYLIYSNFYGLYSNIKNKEKEIFYLRKALSVKKSTYMLIELARYHNIYSNNKDSAKFYLEKAQKIAITDFDNAALYNQWAKYYEENDEYEKAIEFYKKNELLAIKTKEAPLQEDALIGLYNCYQKLGNLKEAIKYSEKRNKFKDSIKSIQEKNSNITIYDIIKKNENKIKNKYSLTQRIFVFLSISVLFFFILLALKLYKNQKENKKAIYQIKIKEEENQELQQKINESFDEVIKLAKENSQEFLTRFTEVYPQVINKLLELDPKLRVTELTLLAYIFLGFTTKDIANYTFKSTNTIRNRKFNLRKKLGIPGDDDMEIWIKALLGNPT